MFTDEQFEDYKKRVVPKVGNYNPIYRWSFAKDNISKP